MDSELKARPKWYKVTKLESRQRPLQTKVNDHPQSGWREFSAIGEKRQKHVSALIVANETGPEAPGLKQPIIRIRPGSYMHPSSKNKQPFISFKAVSLRLDNHVVFPNTNWKLYSHEHWAIIGANGSGKSVLAKALCGQVPVFRGKLIYHFLKQRPLAPSSETTASRQDDIAYVCFDQQKKVLTHEARIHQARWHSSETVDSLPVSDYLSETHVKRINPYQINGPQPNPEIFNTQRNHVVSKLDIQSLMAKKIVHLSNGEMRKVMLARALLKRPRLIILDNPFTGLDQEYRRRLKTILNDLMKDEMRVMIVTSRRDDILPGITHLLVVENKKIAAKGSKQELLDTRIVRSLWNTGPSIDFDLRAPQIRKPRPEYDKNDVLVDMRNVTISYNTLKVLHDINWTVKSGENWALIGPNGSGKTTLLSLILGDNPQAYANDIKLFGRRKGSGECIWEIKKKIGFVSSELHLHYPKHLLVRDVVCSGFFDSIGLYRRCTSTQRRTAASWLKDLRLSTYSDARFDKLSDGIQRIILIVRAIVKQPMMLIMDEPCQGLDEDNRHQILNLIDAISSHLQITVIYVTHEIDELPGVISHILRIENGKTIGIMDADQWASSIEPS